MSDPVNLASQVHSERREHYSHRDLVADVIPFLAARLDEELTLTSIASAAATSRFHFNRLFREVTGIPPCQFLYAMRIARAKKLLLGSGLKVIDICYEVGYQSLGTFTRRFTELVGASPSRFRRQAKRLSDQNEPVTLPPQHFGHNVSECACHGIVAAPPEFRGCIFVALFPEAIPQGAPESCTIMRGAGPFALGDLQEGTFYLFALALPTPLDPSSLFDAPKAWRAGGQCIRVSSDSVPTPVTLVLRPPEPIDPPVLVALQPMLSRWRQEGPSNYTKTDVLLPVFQGGETLGTEGSTAGGD